MHTHACTTEAAARPGHLVLPDDFDLGAPRAGQYIQSTY